MAHAQRSPVPQPAGATVTTAVGPTWAAAARTAALCWLLTGAGYAVLAALDEHALPVAGLLVAGLARWFLERHRVWPAAVAATLTGSATLFLLLDTLRADLGRHLADALSTGAATTVALAVFTLTARLHAGRSRRRA